jgi:twitching motility protein PilI
MPPGESRLLLVHPRFGVNAALRIERALGLRALTELTPQPTPTDAATWEVAHWRGADDQAWIEISMQHLVAMPSFMEAGL